MIAGLALPAGACSGVVAFCPSDPYRQQTPCLAVASGPELLVLCRPMQAVARLTVPQVPAGAAEQARCARGGGSQKNSTHSFATVITASTYACALAFILPSPYCINTSIIGQADAPTLVQPDITCLDLLPKGVRGKVCGCRVAGPRGGEGNGGREGRSVHC